MELAEGVYIASFVDNMVEPGSFYWHEPGVIAVFFGAS